MPYREHCYRRRVQFAETDLAGMVHFSWYLRYVEEAEHDLWRAAGLSIADPDAPVGFPRVSFAIEYHAPLRFEDVIEIRIRIEAITSRTIRYQSVVTRDGRTIATSTHTAVCVRTAPAPMEAVDIPADVVARLGGPGATPAGD